MTALILATLAIAGVALLVMVVVAFPLRRRALPVAPALGERIQGVADRVDLDSASPAYGVLASPERTRRNQRRFESAEHRVVALLSPGTLPTSRSRPARGPVTPRHRS